MILMRIRCHPTCYFIYELGEVLKGVQADFDFGLKEMIQTSKVDIINDHCVVGHYKL